MNQYYNLNKYYHVIILILLQTVPVPSVSLTAFPFEPQTVGRRLTLQCEVTAVRGITSRVDVVWSRDGAEVNRIMGLNVTSTTASTMMYRHSYSTPEPLMLNDTGTVFQCEVMIGTNPPVMNSDDSFTLEVAGKPSYALYIMLYTVYEFKVYLYFVNNYENHTWQ